MGINLIPVPAEDTTNILPVPQAPQTPVQQAPVMQAQQASQDNTNLLPVPPANQTQSAYSRIGHTITTLLDLINMGGTQGPNVRGPEQQKLADAMQQAAPLGPSLVAGGKEFGGNLEKAVEQSPETMAYMGKLFAGDPEATLKLYQGTANVLGSQFDFKGRGIVGGTLEGLGNVADGFLFAPVRSLTAAATGVDPLTLEAETPEERGHAIVDATAAIVGYAIGAGVSKALPEAVGSADLAGMSVGQLQSVARQAAGGGRTLGAIRGFAAGAAGGLAYGTIEGQDQKDVLAQAFVFGGMGAGMEFALHGEGPEAITAANARRLSRNLQIQNLERAFKIDPGDNLAGLHIRESALATSRNYGEALLRGVVPLDEAVPVRVGGLSEEDVGYLGDVSKRLATEGNTSKQLVMLNRGSEALFVHPDLVSDLGPHYLRTGFVPGEVVSFEGRTHMVDVEGSSTNDVVALKDVSNNNSFVVPNDQVTKGPIAGIHEPLDLNSARLRLQLGKELDAYSGNYEKTPTAEANRSALQSAQTGEPITLVQFGGKSAFTGLQDAERVAFTNPLRISGNLEDVQDFIASHPDLPQGAKAALLGSGRPDAVAHAAEALGHDGLIWDHGTDTDITKLGEPDPVNWKEVAYKNWRAGVGQDESFDASFGRWTRDHGIAGNQKLALAKEFGGMLVKEAALPETGDLNTLLEGNRDFLNKLNKNDIRKLSDLATKAGFFLDAHPDGRVNLHAQESGMLVGRFATRDALYDHLRQSLAPKGPALDEGGGSKVPPGAGAGWSQAPDDGASAHLAEPPVPRQWGVGQFIDKASAYLNTAAGVLSNRGDQAKSIDKVFNTHFFNDVVDKLQQKAMMKQADMLGYAEDLRDIAHMAKQDPDFRPETVFNYRETMTYDEAKANMISRPVTDLEENDAKWFASRGTDFKRVFDYTRERSNLRQQADASMQRAGQNPVQLEQIRQKLDANEQTLRSKYNIDPTHQEAADRLDEIRKSNPNVRAAYPVVTLAEMLMDGGGMSRSDFAAHHKMSFAELAVAQRLDEFYDGLADHFNIPDARRITNYANHYQRFREDPTAGMTRPGPAGDFISELTRTGEITKPLSDPFQAAITYLNQGMNALHLKDAWNEAQETFNYEKEIVKGSFPASIADPAMKYVLAPISDFMRSIRGIPGYSETMLNTLMQKFFDGHPQIMNALSKLGFKDSGSVASSATNFILNMSAGAFLGFKPELGIRDFSNIVAAHYARFGAVRTAHILANMLDPGIVKRLAEEGRLSGGLSPQDIYSHEESLTRAGAGLDGGFLGLASRLGEIGLSTSGQRYVYPRMRSAIYQEAYQLSRDVLTQLGQDKITKAQAWDRLDLHTYDKSVADKFDEHVKAGQFETASDYLARTTSLEQVALHGLSNQPWLWGSIPGRLLTQYGMWAAWARNYAVRLASHGSPTQALGALTRFGITQAAIHSAELASGLNLHSWYMLPGTLNVLGPIGQRASTGVQGLIGGQGSRAQQEAWKDMTSLFQPGSWGDMMVPGSDGFVNLMDAWNKSGGEYGYNPAQIVGRGLGFKLDDGKRSFADWFFHT